MLFDIILMSGHMLINIKLLSGIIPAAILRKNEQNYFQIFKKEKITCIQLLIKSNLTSL